MKTSLIRSLKTILLLPVLAVHFSLAQAQDGGTVEDRVDSLEQKMDRILNLLESKASPPASTPATEPATAAAPDQPAPPPTTPPAPEPPKESLKEGTILEVWLLDNSYKGTTPPPTRSTGTLVDMGEPFNGSNFLAENALDYIKKQRLAMRWSGFIVIRDPGEYNFSLQLTKGEGKLHNRVGISSSDVVNINFLISGEEKISIGARLDSDPFNQTFTEKQPSIFEKGIYPFVLSFLPIPYNSNEWSRPWWNYDNLKFQLKVRGPSDLTPRLMTIKDFVHKN